MERYQKMLKKRDKIDNWWKGYLVNIKRLELQLPDNTSVSINSVESKKTADGNEYANLNITKPNSSTYTKNGIKGEIKKPVKEKGIEVSGSYTPSRTNNNSNSSSTSSSNTTGSSRSGSGASIIIKSRRNGTENKTTIKNSPEQIEKDKAKNPNYHQSWAKPKYPSQQTKKDNISKVMDNVTNTNGSTIDRAINNEMKGLRK